MFELAKTSKPRWLTFDCYGTLIRWDEGLLESAAAVAEKRGGSLPRTGFVEAYDSHESRLERGEAFNSFRTVARIAFPAALHDFGVAASTEDGDSFVAAIAGFDPFPETLDTLATFKAAGFRIALVSNTDDDIVAGNVARLGGHVDEVVTAQQARAYKPSPLIFAHALCKLGIEFDDMLHVCASPALDHAAARDQRFRCVWIDRGTYRKPLPDYRPDATFPTLAGVPRLFTELGWISE